MSTVGFWRELRQDNRNVTLTGFGQLQRTWFLFPQGNGPRGAFTTFAQIKPNLKSKDVIILGGVLREQAVTPLGVFDVTIMGAANQPRQATNGGVPTGGGASWLAPTSPVATTALIRVIEQGWSFENIQFAPVAASNCIEFDREETALIPDSSHGLVTGCYFSTGGAAGHGIGMKGVKKIVIENNLFEALTGAGGHAIHEILIGAVSVCSHCIIRGNKFMQNANDIRVAAGQFNLVEKNVFYSTNPVTVGNRVNLNGGINNAVLDNSFKDVAVDITIAKGYDPGVTGQWRNWSSDTNVPIVAVPV